MEAMALQLLSKYLQQTTLGALGELHKYKCNKQEGYLLNTSLYFHFQPFLPYNRFTQRIWQRFKVLCSLTFCSIQSLGTD